MRIWIVMSALALSVGAAQAAPRAVAGFTSVEARSGVDVEVAVGAAFSVDVNGRDADRIVTRVAGDTLIVEPVRNVPWRNRRDAHVRITMPRIEGLSSSSGADLVATGVNGGNVALAASSGADLRVSGTCATLSADASSGADIHASDLHCQSGAVSASSGADARVFASGRLDVDASSGAGVLAYGGASPGNISLSSGGSFRRAD